MSRVLKVFGAADPDIVLMIANGLLIKLHFFCTGALMGSGYGVHYVLCVISIIQSCNSRVKMI